MSTSWSKSKKLLFRVAAALLVPGLLLCLLEIALRLAGYGYPTHFFLHGQLQGQKIIHDNQEFGWRFFPPLSARTPRPVVLPAAKPPGTCRVFVFGESAAFGDPSPAFGLPRFLEVLLRNRYPSTHFEVLNVAMTAINSNVILPIAYDCAREQGDIWVLYIGNNEVVGPYGGGTVFGPQVPPLSFIRASIAMNTCKISQLLNGFRRGLHRAEPDNEQNRIGLGLFLDQKVRQSDPRMNSVYSHFAQNLEDLLRVAIKSGAKVVVSTVAANLKDCAPFASLHRADLNEADKKEWTRLFDLGVGAEQAGDYPGAIKAYEQAERIDGTFAELQFREAQDLQRTGDFESARRHFALARDYDGLRFRADSRINEIIRQVASNRVGEGIAFVDGEEALAQSSPHRTIGKELLLEHVHLNLAGNYILARALAERIQSLLPPAVARNSTADWLSHKECVAQLGFNDWDRYQMLEILRQRLEAAPFTGRINNSEQCGQIKQELADLQGAFAPEMRARQVSLCENALAINPRDWVLHQKLARLLGQSRDEASQARAVEEWRRVIDSIPHYAEAHYELGVLLGQSGETGLLSEAASQLHTAVALKRSYYPEALDALGNVLAKQGKFDDAIQAYEAALRLRPSSVKALVDLSVALNHEGKKEEAKARLEEARRYKPDDENAARARGNLLNENGQVSSAIEHYSELLRQNPQDAMLNYKLGECYGLLGQHADAERYYEAALRIQPDFVDAHCRIGVELGEMGKPTEAMSHFAEAIRLKPDLAEAHKNMGVALAKQRKFDEAAKQFEEAVRLDPGDVTARKYLQAARHYRDQKSAQ